MENVSTDMPLNGPRMSTELTKLALIAAMTGAISSVSSRRRPISKSQEQRKAKERTAAANIKRDKRKMRKKNRGW